MNHLYYGDNLDVLRQHVGDESVDLIYLDPPFKSNQDYNVLFAEKDGTRSAAQIKAFEDTWQWDQAAAGAFQETVELGGKVSQVMQAFRLFLGDTDMLAYLAMMAPRLGELRRVLKPMGGIYLHCDPTASHYLKLLLDAIFGPEQFKSEVIWKRTSAHSSAKRHGPVHDTLLYYVKTDEYTWNPSYQPYDEGYITAFFEQVDPNGRRWTRGNLTGPGVRGGDSGKKWRSINVTAKGRHWQPASYLYEKYKKLTGDDLAQYPLLDRLDKLDHLGLIHWPEKRDGMPRYKCYLEDMPGIPLQDMWTDINPIHNLAAERLGYPTQKPVALLERILIASSNKEDVVLDPFCGCGTAIEAAHNLERQWIGIDVTRLAITLIKSRLKSAFGDGIEKSYKVTGEPPDLPGAQNLAREDPYQFQWWALGLVGARPVEQKKGADKGIDGRLYFHDDRKSGQTKQIIFSVKAGGVTVSQLRDLRGVVEREKAQMGVLISMEEPTKPMRTEAAGAGFYDSPWGSRHPKLQIRTIEELLGGKGVDRPPHDGNVTFKKAPRVYKKQEEQPELL